MYKRWYTTSQYLYQQYDSIRKQSLRFDKIEVRIIEENNFLYTLLKFGETLMFELDFDPTLYKDDRIINIIKSNLVHLISTESNNNLIQTLRLVNVPLKLFIKWHTIWINAKDIDNYSKKYKNWVFDLQIDIHLLNYGNMENILERWENKNMNYSISLSEVINIIKENQIFKANYAINQYWYITKHAGFIWYCDENGIIDEVVPLTYSNINAKYELIKE